MRGRRTAPTRITTSLATAALACALAACGPRASSPDPGNHPGGGGVGAAGTGASGGVGAFGGAGAAAGSSGALGGSTGAAGVSASFDASGEDAASTNDAGLSSDDAHDGDGTGGLSACAPPAFLCDTFETYPAGATTLGADWTTYTYSGAVRVDATKPRAGKQSLHLTTQAGAHHYADLIRETRGQQILPLKHYGRLMAWLTAVPPSSHWNLNMSSGPMVGAPDEQAKFFEGGMYGKLMSNYAQRGRILANGQELLRGGGPEAGDPGAEADCAVAAPTETLAAGRWVCWEWEFDGPANEAHLWVDGQPMSEVDAVGSGKQCQGPGFMGRKMMANYKWEGPALFDKLIIGWEQYQDTPAQELWIDDLVMSTERVGCPPP